MKNSGSKYEYTSMLDVRTEIENVLSSFDKFSNRFHGFDEYLKYACKFNRWGNFRTYWQWHGMVARRALEFGENVGFCSTANPCGLSENLIISRDSPQTQPYSPNES